MASDYFSRITVDPKHPDRIYAMGRSIRDPTDGGRHWTIIKGAPGGDDYHDLWIDPRDPQRMITASDQGAVITVNGGAPGRAGTTSRPASSTTWRRTTSSRTGSIPASRIRAPSASPAAATTARSASATGTRSAATNATTTSRIRAIPASCSVRAWAGACRAGTARTGVVQNVTPWPVNSYGAAPDRLSLPLHLDHPDRVLGQAAVCAVHGRAGAVPQHRPGPALGRDQPAAERAQARRNALRRQPDAAPGLRLAATASSIPSRPRRAATR